MADYRSKVVSSAKSQLGVCEPVGDDKYIKWYNSVAKTSLSMNVAWCAIFVSWNLRAADVSTDVFPNFASCSIGISWAKKHGVWKTKTSGHAPKPGDLIFFDWDTDGKADHVGIVESASAKIVTTIEGNSNNSVQEKTYAISSKYIFGYAAPEYDSPGSMTTVAVVSSPAKDRIKDMQQLLKDVFRQSIACDGVWGAKSKKALIKALQQTINDEMGKSALVEDGVWGPKTESAMPNILKGDSGPMVHLIQIALNVQSYTIDVDGQFGSKTEAAVKTFQTKQRLSSDGIVGKKTMAALVK